MTQGPRGRTAPPPDIYPHLDDVPFTVHWIADQQASIFWRVWAGLERRQVLGVVNRSPRPVATHSARAGQLQATRVERRFADARVSMTVAQPISTQRRRVDNQNLAIELDH